MPNETKWEAVIHPPHEWRVLCGPLFRLELIPNLEETAKVENAYELAARVIQFAAASLDLYEALEELLKDGEHEGPCDNEEDDSGTRPCTLHLAAIEARRTKARLALAKANPQ